MPRCKICRNYFIGGSPKHDDNICLYCYAKIYAKSRISKLKQKR